jgi:hypothetical protein
MDPFLGWALQGVGSLKQQVLEILVCLSLGTGQLVVFNWEMEKWFHLRFGDEGFGLVDGRVGIWIGFGCGVCSAEEKNSGKIDC